MASAAPIDPKEFVRRVGPALERKDVAGLCQILKSNWSVEQLRELLQGPDRDARKVALLSMALVGTQRCIPHLAELLKDPDPLTHSLAEHALWSIWFRIGSNSAADVLSHGVEALEQRDAETAISDFTHAIELDPCFAEAFNQRAIAHYLSERYVESIEDCRQTIKRMPCHFGALAGMGHCYAHLGNVSAALRCYQDALKIHPYLDGIKEAIMHLSCCCDEGKDEAC